MKALCDNTKDKEEIKVLKVTVDQVMSWLPCEDYTRERVEELFAGREALSAMEILELDIPVGDKLWAVLREELIPAETLYEFGCRCDTAWDTAWDAADAAWDAANAAAWDVADAADAAWDTAMSAARSAQVAILQTLLREAEEA